MPDWPHPRIANPACRLDHFDDIAAEARAAFERRKDTYPIMVSSGSLDIDDARDDLEAWRAIAKSWRHIATGKGEIARRLTLAARIEALDTAIGRWFDMIDQSGSPNETEKEQCALLCAMRIWADREAAYYAAGNLLWSSGHIRGILSRDFAPALWIPPCAKERRAA